VEWHQVLEDKTLADLPYKIELNEWGNIEMSPASNLHSLLQTIIASALNEHMDSGRAFVECSVLTAKNVKVADVVWGSDGFFQAHGFETPYRSAPEICVEVVSPSNTMAEMMVKKDLYLVGGAREFWLCDESGALRFFGHGGELARSGLCLGFPLKLAVP